MTNKENQKEKRAKTELSKYINFIKRLCSPIYTDFFINKNDVLINTILNSRDAGYILNINTMQYVLLNDKFSFISGYKNDEIINGNWIYPIDLAFNEDRLALCVVLKEQYRLLNELNIEDRMKARTEITYRMENRNKEIVTLMQESEIIALDSNSAPVLEMGKIKVIGWMKKDTKVSGIIELNNTTTIIDPTKLLKKLKPYSDHQFKVIHYAAEGNTSEETAGKIGKKKHQVITTRKSIMKKDKAKNVTEVVAKAIKKGEL